MKNYVKGEKNSVISASEIGQYCFCSISWYLQKQGLKPNSELLEIGQKKHDELGELINKAEKEIVKLKILTFIGYFVLFFSILILIFEVFL